MVKVLIQEVNEIFNSPKIYTISNFITEEECQHFINISRDNIKPALVSGDKEGFISSGRSGQNHWIPHNTDNITKRIGEKIAEQVGIPLENAEAYQIIYYDKSQEYRQHYDGWLFDGSEKSRRNMKYGGQRVKTALVYLNDVNAGGGTKFTKLNLEVNAEKGKLLVFENVHSGTNKRHELSEHAGMPVIEGEKWAFNLWFREESRQKLYDYKEETPLKPPSNISILDNVNFSIVKGDTPLKPTEGNTSYEVEGDTSSGVEGVPPSNEIKRYESFLSSDDMLKIVMNCYFEDKERATAWVNRERIPEIIKKIEELLKIDSAYFESMCVTKYAPKIIHRDHQDAYDLTTAKGKENTRQTGQRLITITGFLSEIKVTFQKLGKEFNQKKGDLLVYNNCYNESDKRNENMIKNYAPEGDTPSTPKEDNASSPSSMLLFNIYVREKSRTKGGILKIANGIIESKIEEKQEKQEKQEIKCNLSSEELIHMIYTRNPFEIMKIPGFKLTNKAPIDYVVDTLLKIKILRDCSNNGFLNSVNLEKEYFIDEYNPVVVEDVINPEIHELVDEYFKTNIKNGVYPFGDRQSQRYKIIDEIMTRLLHLEFLPLIEKIVGRKMEATYTYISAYVKGADLPAHTDRPECEFTCSYIIGKPINTNWNIYLHKTKQPEKYKGRYDFTPPKDECIAVDCNQNGLMIFNGTDHIHYREPLEHEYYNVVLLHYKGR